MAKSKWRTKATIEPQPAQMIRLGWDREQPQLVLTIDTRYEHVHVSGTHPHRAVEVIAKGADYAGFAVYSVHGSLPGGASIAVDELPGCLPDEGSPAVVFATDEAAMTAAERKYIYELADTSTPTMCLVTLQAGGRLVAGFEDGVSIYCDGQLRTIDDEVL